MCITLHCYVLPHFYCSTVIVSEPGGIVAHMQCVLPAHIGQVICEPTTASRPQLQMGKMARLLIYWQDSDCCLVIPSIGQKIIKWTVCMQQASQNNNMKGTAQPVSVRCPTAHATVALYMLRAVIFGCIRCMQTVHLIIFWPISGKWCMRINTIIKAASGKLVWKQH